jgi:putative hydrolase of the HAD superfamily
VSEAVLFDLDGTLCEYRRPGERVLAASFEAVGVDPFFAVDEYYDRYGEFAPESSGPRELRQRAFEAIAVDRGRDRALGRDLAAAYADRRDHAAVDPLPGTPEVVRDLADDRRVGLVTNGGPAMQRTKLASLGVDDAFETVVFAGHHNEGVGSVPAKPDPAPFNLALRNLGVAPGDTVYVGNAPEADVAGGAAAGLTTVLVGDRDPADGPVAPDHAVDAVADLPDLL